MSLKHQQIIEWKCNGCAVVETQSLRVHEGAQPMVPVLPKGWTEIDGLTFCTAHVLELRCDRKTKYQVKHGVGVVFAGP